MIVAVCPKCGADLEALTYTTYPPVHAYRCRNCGWTQEERTNITRVPIATVERKPLTNADRTRAMSDAELAGAIVQTYGEGSVCPPKHTHIFCVLEHGCKKCWLDWLKQEAKE